MNIQSVRFAVLTCSVCASPHAEGKDCRGNVYESRMAERYRQRLKRAETLLSDWQSARNIRP